MVIKSEVLEQVRTTVKGEFAKRLETLAASNIYNQLATTVNSTSKSNTYGWLGSFPKMREWVGDRVAQSIKESAYALENKKFESTLDVERTDIEDDNIGKYPAMSRGMADEIVAFFNRCIAELMESGSASLCYDGQNFFDREHPVYPKTDGTGTAEKVSNILGSDEADGAPWFLLCLSENLKPFILQQRTTPEMEEITDTKNDTVFTKDVYQFGIRWRGNFGYGLWQLAVMSREPLTAENYQKAREMMQRFKRDGGDPLGAVPTHLVVNMQNETAARKIVLAKVVDGSSNINYKTAELIVSPWLKEV